MASRGVIFGGPAARPRVPLRPNWFPPRRSTGRGHGEIRSQKEVGPAELYSERARIRPHVACRGGIPLHAGTAANWSVRNRFLVKRQAPDLWHRRLPVGMVTGPNPHSHAVAKPTFALPRKWCSRTHAPRQILRGAWNSLPMRPARHLLASLRLERCVGRFRADVRAADNPGAPVWRGQLL